MSVQYDKVIFADENFTLKVNFFGIKDDMADATNLTMSLFAYDSFGSPKFSHTLDFSQIKNLYEHLTLISIIKDSSQTISGKFIETTDEISGILKVVLNKIKEEDRLKNLLISLSEEDEAGESLMERLSTLQKQQDWQKEIENLNKLLQFEESGKVVDEAKKDIGLKPYVAAQPEKIFQNWIEKNVKWIFGVEYIKKYDVRKIAFFSEGDILMESMDGFLDLIELKRPNCELFKYDESHKSYYPSPDLSKVIGQSLLYFEKLDDFKLNLEKEHKVKIIRPRIKIIAGRTKNFNQEMYNALRMLNSNLNHIEIISYDYLLHCGEKMIANYK